MGNNGSCIKSNGSLLAGKTNEVSHKKKGNNRKKAPNSQAFHSVVPSDAKTPTRPPRRVSEPDSFSRGESNSREKPTVAAKGKLVTKRTNTPQPPTPTVQPSAQHHGSSVGEAMLQPGNSAKVTPKASQRLRPYSKQPSSQRPLPSPGVEGNVLDPTTLITIVSPDDAIIHDAWTMHPSGGITLDSSNNTSEHPQNVLLHSPQIALHLSHGSHPTRNSNQQLLGQSLNSPLLTGADPAMCSSTSLLLSPQTAGGPVREFEVSPYVEAFEECPKVDAFVLDLGPNNVSLTVSAPAALLGAHDAKKAHVKGAAKGRHPLAETNAAKRAALLHSTQSESTLARSTVSSGQRDLPFDPLTGTQRAAISAWVDTTDIGHGPAGPLRDPQDYFKHSAAAIVNSIPERELSRFQSDVSLGSTRSVC